MPCDERLDRLNVRGVGALGPVLSVVADLRALGERLEAAAGDARVVHEQVLALVVGCDEAEALLVAEPLHGSCSHLVLPGGVCGRSARGAKSNYDETRALLAPDTVARPSPCSVSASARSAVILGRP